MRSASEVEPRIAHSLPGRVRVHLPQWPCGGRVALEREMLQIGGIWSVRANELTGNILLHFDSRATNQVAILARLRSLGAVPATLAAGPPEHPAPLEDGPEQNRRKHIDSRNSVRGCRTFAPAKRPAREQEWANAPKSEPAVWERPRTLGSAIKLGLCGTRRYAKAHGRLGAIRAVAGSSLLGRSKLSTLICESLSRFLGRNAAELVWNIVELVSSSPLDLACAGAMLLLSLAEVLVDRPPMLYRSGEKLTMGVSP